MNDFSLRSASESEGLVTTNPDDRSEIEAAAETGRRLWYQLAALVVVGVASVCVLISQLVSAQDRAFTVQAERNQAVSELGLAKSRIEELAGELAAAKATQAEQAVATDKDARRIEGEVAALKAQRAALTTQVGELVKRQQEAERGLAAATQRQTDVERQLSAIRAELAAARTESKARRHRKPRPAPTPDNTP